MELSFYLEMLAIGIGIPMLVPLHLAGGIAVAAVAARTARTERGEVLLLLAISYLVAFGIEWTWFLIYRMPVMLPSDAVGGLSRRALAIGLNAGLVLWAISAYRKRRKASAA